MKTHRLILSASLAALFLGFATPQFAQDPASPEKNDEQQLHRALLIGLMRTINTAEVTDRSTYGSYAPWETLLAHQQEYFNGWVARYHPEVASGRFADMPEILPGLTLRLSVHADGQGYDVRLKDTAERKWVFGAFSDESGVIWQGEPLH